MKTCKVYINDILICTMPVNKVEAALVAMRKAGLTNVYIREKTDD